MKCNECQKESPILLIDTNVPLGTPERERRYCPECRAEYHVPARAGLKIRWPQGREGSSLFCNAKISFLAFSGQLRDILESGNFADFPRKRHQRKHLVFFPPCFASTRTHS